MGLKRLLNTLLKEHGQELKDSIKKKLSGIISSTDWLLILADKFISVNHLKADSYELQATKCNSTEIVDDAVAALSGLAEERGIEITRKSESAHLYVDKYQITQVLLNLLSNALKFSPKDSVVEIITKPIGNQLEIRVNDSAEIIPEETRDRLFKKFEQNKSKSAKVKGSGFGLYICKLIVESHGGFIEVDTNENRGNSFYFRIDKNVLAS